MERLKRFWPVLFLALVSLLPLWKAVFGGEVIGAFDQIHQMAPWNGPKPPQAWDVLQADGVLQFYPWRDMVLSAWGKGQMPFWNPYELAGTPLLANSQSAGFYPPHILLGLLRVPTGTAITLLAWLHLFVAGLGVYYLVRRLGGTKEGATVAGFSFSCSAFMLSWVALASVGTTVCWIPWMLGLTLALFERSRPSLIACLAGAVALMVLGGHLQFVAYGFMAEAALLIWLAVAQRSFGGTAKTISGLILGVLLAAPQLVPVLNYSQFSHRRNTPDEAGYSAYIGTSVRPQDFVARLGNPLAQGDPTKPIAEGQPSSFWPTLAQRGANFAESASTVGPIVLLLLCLIPYGRVAWRKAGGIVLIGLVAALLGIGTPLNKLLYFGVPGWSSSGSPSRVLVLFVLAACALAGLGFPDDLASRPKKQLGYALGAFALLFLVGLMPSSAPAPAGIAADTWSTIVAQGNMGGYSLYLVSALAGIGIVAGAALKRREVIVFAPAVLVALTLVPLIRTGDPSFLKPQPVVSMERVAVVNGPWDLTMAAPAVLPPNTASSMHIHELGGYDSLLHRDTVALLKDVDGEDPGALANGNMMFIKSKADAKKLAEAGVTKVWSRKPIDGLAKASQREGYIESKVDGPGRVSLSNGTAEIAEEGTDHILLNVNGSGHLILRDRNLPGWSAAVDGKSLPISGTTWREMEIPAGAKQVLMRYSPPGLPQGLMMLLAGLVGTVGVGIWGVRSKIKTT